MRASLSPQFLENTAKVFRVAAISAVALTAILGFNVPILTFVWIPFVTAILLLGFTANLCAKDAAEDRVLVKKIRLFKLINGEKEAIKTYILQTSPLTPSEKIKALESLSNIENYLKEFECK